MILNILKKNKIFKNTKSLINFCSIFYNSVYLKTNVMKKVDKSYLKKKINKLNKKIHRSENQNEDNKTWWRKLKITKLKHKINHTE